MSKMLNYIKVTKKYIRRSPYQALSAVLIMIITFFVATVLALLTYVSYSTLHYFETRPQIIAFLNAEATPDQISSLQKDLISDSRIKDLKFVSKEQALNIYKEATSDNPLLSELVSPKVFPASLEFSVTDLQLTESVFSEIGKKDAVGQVVFTASLGGSKSIKDVIDNLRNITNYIKIGGGVIVSFLLGSSLIILLVIISMRIASRREEIRILQLLGATPGFIRAPFVFEGIIYAILGSFLGWLFATLALLYISPSLVKYFGDIPILPPTTNGILQLFGAILGIEVLVALILGILGSFVAIKRYLKI
ncbi:MAG: hypothetical protein A3D24_01445 [Candidatus Blackburnbacteria bacterium RIFCSPHIGHO2_02_FULL_39_13]|uniref:Cell division protein FtsX n=1 Tax=Candidatus Blackburnbacteria bacterium RIFCSPLOWO2_01_FULL_40_20 TaxID=1797519 RepID=A0A1G1VFA1_9BACT|nr:MAG: hypothetical protein A2694_00550 [Candidatus Blackburnbacteria bacterium RIFCSPHIGHO2_01_FULL_40_17]OGY09808.1 MAG: hypothetical protein A3D24_01445 [Candidatus Blackburnbacteria bacterium RIFCSPHIGHO2_02_FULL_39_13]OGY14088.1 MAG: hypothetical protein A3A77_03890 [Candidatus Blackburnbacteria bacterium RIFCSPLOWO2_01_FULL_40_20]